jgi:hypothetical protein
MITRENKTAVERDHDSMSFWQFFRMIFVLFSLYLLGDAFYRWDGIRMYASFVDYFPSVALAAIIWSILAVLTAIIVWLPLKAIKRMCAFVGINVTTYHFVFYSGVFVTFIAAAWIGKKLIWSDFQTSFQLKLVLMIVLLLISIPVTWLLRDKAALWIKAVQERITPLLWLFGFFVILSFPLAVINTWGKDARLPVTCQRTGTTGRQLHSL